MLCESTFRADNMHMCKLLRFYTGGTDLSWDITVDPNGICEKYVSMEMCAEFKGIGSKEEYILKSDLAGHGILPIDVEDLFPERQATEKMLNYARVILDKIHYYPRVSEKAMEFPIFTFDIADVNDPDMYSYATEVSLTKSFSHVSAFLKEFNLKDNKYGL